MKTLDLISNLTRIDVSEHTRGESLYTLTKHSWFTMIREQLVTCYYNEDYKTARLLCEREYRLHIGDVTKCKTSYAKKYEGNMLKRQSTKLTFGMKMVTQGGDDGWLEGIDRQAKLNLLKRLEDDDTFLSRIVRLKRIIKRKARLSKDKYRRRNKVIVPSKRLNNER